MKSLYTLRLHASFTLQLASGGNDCSVNDRAARSTDQLVPKRVASLLYKRNTYAEGGGKRRPEVSMSQQGPDSNLEAEAEIKISRRQTTLGGALSPTRDNFVSRLRGATAVEGGRKRDQRHGIPRWCISSTPAGSRHRPSAV